MIKFSNGHELLFCNGSGALAFDGCGWYWEWPLRWLGILDPTAFTVVAKTLTLDPTKGNLSLWHPNSCIAVVKRDGMKGMVNAVGLTNPGLGVWINKHYPTAIAKGYKIAVSVKPNNPQEAAHMATMLKYLRLAYVEVNFSCPNASGVHNLPPILEALKECGHPLVLKLSIDQINKDFISATEGFVEAYHAINTIPWSKIFKYDDSPISGYSHGLEGGVSGDHIHSYAIDHVGILKTLTMRPIIGGGGIFDLSHVLSFEKAGASAFSIGTCFALKPWRPNRIVREYLKRQAMLSGYRIV